MELTITQNGALYAVQHGAIKKYRDARNKRAIANRVIRTGKPRPEISAGRKIKKNTACSITAATPTTRKVWQIQHKVESVKL
jgi:hypothetical protein